MISTCLSPLGRSLCFLCASGAPPASPFPLHCAAFPRRSFARSLLPCASGALEGAAFPRRSFARSLPPCASGALEGAAFPRRSFARSLLPCASGALEGAAFPRRSFARSLLPCASGALEGAAFPRRSFARSSFLAPQSRQRRAPLARAPSARSPLAGRDELGDPGELSPHVIGHVGLGQAFLSRRELGCRLILGPALAARLLDQPGGAHQGLLTQRVRPGQQPGEVPCLRRLPGQRGHHGQRLLPRPQVRADRLARHLGGTPEIGRAHV